MLAKFLRRFFGSVRLFLTLLAFAVGCFVVFLDIFRGLRLGPAIYGYLTSIFGVVAVFIWKDTDRPAGYNHNGIRYKTEKDGEV